MHRILTITALSLMYAVTALAQTSAVVELPKAAYDKKGSFYASWGWNEDRYTKSDIQFIGDDYDFTLENVKAVQRQNKFEASKFLNPLNASIPQFNFRIGYYLRDDFDVFIGTDHMKYVVPPGQSVTIKGHIRNNESIYDGEYSGESIEITDEFLDMEHTDGLNYVHVGARKSHTFFTKGWLSFGAYETFSVGVLYPRSDITVIGKERHNEYAVAGLGFAASGGLEVSLWRHFFLESELKGGYTNMPWIRSTNSTSDKAKQDFWFGQAIVQFGGRWSFKRRNANLSK